MHADFRAFLAHLAITHKSPKTIERYGHVLADLDSFVDGAAPPSIDRGSLQRFAIAPRRDGSPRSAAGTNLRIATVRAVFAYLVAEGRSATNPAAGLVGVPERRRTPKYLTNPEVRGLLEHVAASSGSYRVRNVALVVTLWQTALRVSELARLRFSQLDLEARLFRDVLIKGGHVVDVALNDETIVVLNRYLAERGTLNGDAPLFARTDGGRLSVRAIQALFERWRRELGWTRSLHPHVMRHTHATTALAEGVDIAVVADLLRHKGLRQVMTYASVQDAGRREALRKLGRLVPTSIIDGAVPAPANDAGATPSTAGTGTPSTSAENTCVEEPFDAAA